MSDQLPRSLSGMDSQSNVIQNLKKHCKETYPTKKGKKENFDGEMYFKKYNFHLYFELLPL